jgi:hypothetical protein
VNGERRSRPSERDARGDRKDVGSFAPREPAAASSRKRRPMPAAFLGGAIGRLLPPSVPFRYFAAAAVFHLLAWLALLAGAERVARFRGGLGWPLAALHLVTLGVLVMTALGASMQLFPVATRQPLRSTRAPVVVWWLYTPGVALATLGIGIASATVLATGAALVALALVVYAVVLGRNLLGARGMPVVVAYGWAAWASLAIALVAALSLACGYAGAPFLARDTALALHVPFAAYGFLGMLALGLAHVVVPMFALSPATDERVALVSFGLALAALVLTAAAAFTLSAPVRIAAIALAIVAVTLHLRSMQAAIRTGMRRDLGRGFRLVRVGWSMLVVNLFVALAVYAGVPFDALATLYGFTLIAGWLLTYALGMLHRIVPFLASMHAARGSHRPPTPSSLAAGRAPALHGMAHLAALVLLALAIVVDSAWLVRAAALVGAAGAVAFLVFVIGVIVRMGVGDRAANGRAATA